MQYWLIKSEPFVYSFDDLEKEGKTLWEGVRNYQARNNLRAMKKGDLALFYHSNEGLEVVGVAKVSKNIIPTPPLKKGLVCGRICPPQKTGPSCHPSKK
jgi:predicted RNA-binding protein with PUA-like domain